MVVGLFFDTYMLAVIVIEIQNTHKTAGLPNQLKGVGVISRDDDKCFLQVHSRLDVFDNRIEMRHLIESTSTLITMMSVVDATAFNEQEVAVGLSFEHIKCLSHIIEKIGIRFSQVMRIRHVISVREAYTSKSLFIKNSLTTYQGCNHLLRHRRRQVHPAC